MVNVVVEPNRGQGMDWAGTSLEVMLELRAEGRAEDPAG